MGKKLCISICLVNGLWAAGEGSVSTVAPGVWFRQGETRLGYCNNAIIEMKDYLIVVDANYPGGAREVMAAAGSCRRNP